VLVVTALGTLARADLERLGFAVIERPATVGEIVNAVSERLRASRATATQSKE
jgi:hypothetical protein